MANPYLEGKGPSARMYFTHDRREEVEMNWDILILSVCQQILNMSTNNGSLWRRTSHCFIMKPLLIASVRSESLSQGGKFAVSNGVGFTTA